MSPLTRVSAVKWWEESVYLQLVAFLHSSPHSRCLLFCSSSILKTCCWLSRWALFFSVSFFLVQSISLCLCSFPPAACFPSRLICSFIHVDVHLWTLRRWCTRMSWRCPATVRLSKPSAAAGDSLSRKSLETETLAFSHLHSLLCACIIKHGHTGQSSSLCMCGFPASMLSSGQLWGVCAAASWVGELFECHLLRFWPILNLPESPQDLRALKGTLWWCLCYLCECCCRKRGREKKNGVKPEKPESPQDGQLQQEEVPHVAVTLKCLCKSAHLCVFFRLFMRSRILQV